MCPVNQYRYTSEAIPIRIVNKFNLNNKLLLSLKKRKYNEKNEPIKIPIAPNNENMNRLILMPNRNPLSSSIALGTFITPFFGFFLTFKLN